MCSTKGLLSLSSIVLMLPWFNDAYGFRRCQSLSAGHHVSVPPRCCLPRLGQFGGVLVRVVRVVSILIGLRPSLALRGDGGGESSMRTMTGSRSTGTS